MLFLASFTDQIANFPIFFFYFFLYLRLRAILRWPVLLILHPVMMPENSSFTWKWYYNEVRQWSPLTHILTFVLYPCVLITHCKRSLWPLDILYSKTNNIRVDRNSLMLKLHSSTPGNIISHCRLKANSFKVWIVFKVISSTTQWYNNPIPKRGNK